MNHLAHAYLSGDNDLVLLGNLMGDFVKGTIDTTLPEDIRRGIRLHRLIDAYTDTDPAFQQSRERLDKSFRRYAGILVDIFYDHFLSKYWNDYSTRPLADYAQDIYRLLEREHDLLPERMRRFVSYMISNDILVAYGRLDGIAQVLNGMSRRLSFANPLAEGTDELVRNYDGFREDFDSLLSRITVYAEEQRLGMETGDRRRETGR